MKVIVNMHGPIKTAVGKAAIEIKLPNGANLKDLLYKIIIDYKKIGCQNLEELINSYIVLRDSHILRPDQVLSDEELDAIAEFLKWTSEVNSAGWPPNVQG